MRRTKTYIVRAWTEDSAGDDRRARHRYLVEQVGSEAGRRGFATLDELLAWLRSALRSGDP